MNLPELLGKLVEVRALVKGTDGGESEEVCYRGAVEAVGGTMIKIIECTIIQQSLSRPDPKEMWFNTNDESFQGIRTL